MTAPTLVWFRQDFRLSDHPALAAALQREVSLIPVFIWSPNEDGDWAPGGASRWWLHHALADLKEQLRERGFRLIIRKGAAGAVLSKLLAETGAQAVYWSRRYEPSTIQRDSALKEQLRAAGCEAKSFNSALLFEPWQVATKAGSPYKVYTPFSKAALAQTIPAPVEVSWEAARTPERWPESDPLESLELLPRLDWDSGFHDAWTPTRKGAEGRLGHFLGQAVADYPAARDEPDVDGTSRLSPYLHFGQIGPREVVAALGERRFEKGGGVYLREILWREFAHHVLYHFPSTPTRPLQKGFEAFPWQSDSVALKAWQEGQTGYPIVDAGMRQLWTTGWMHNRVRMIVGSLLVKHLLISWQEGAAWFWDTLVDADLAQNTLGWQWIGGCGADAAPYFRIFNPMTQGAKFDPQGNYVRRWVPELAKIPDKYIHQPWEAPENILEYAGVALGENYPSPIVEHKAGRERALDAFQQLKEAREAAG